MHYQLIWGLMLGPLLLPDSEALSFMLLNYLLQCDVRPHVYSTKLASGCFLYWPSYPLEIINSFSFSYQIHNVFHFSWLYVGRYTLSFICINLMTCPRFHLICCCYFFFFFSLMLNDSTVVFSTVAKPT